MTFADKVLQLRTRKGWTQKQLVEAVGDISSSAVSAWERGAIPAMDVAFRTARALGVPLDYLADDALDELRSDDRPILTEREKLIAWAIETLGFEEASRRLFGGIDHTQNRQEVAPFEDANPPSRSKERAG